MKELPAVSRRADKRLDAVELHSVERFLEAMWDEKKSNQYVFRLYRELPHPGVSYLSKRSRGALLRRFANPTNRRWVDARRYLGLVEDMIAAGLPISRSLWSSAIHLAGRASGKVCKKDLVRSIGLWQQMEHVGGVRSDGVVFGILFDIAIKAGQFTVADRLLEEMAKRDVSFSRAGKVSRIYYYGMLRDPDGIRQALDDFVASGEIVDTPVLNCLLASFLRAGDTETAESLYRRMLESQKSTGLDLEQRIQHQPGLTSELVVYRKKSRKLNTLLQLSAPLREKLPEHHRALQEAFPMAPDTRTFHILLSFHCYETGDIQAFGSVLKDMEKTFAVPPRGMIYLLLFSGFARNGRKRKGWTAERLRGVWKSYLRALYESRARFNDRLHSRPARPTWENPLESDPTLVKTHPPSLPHAPRGLYTPLPTSNHGNESEKTHASTAGAHSVSTHASEEQTQSSEHYEATYHEDDEIDTDELFGHRTRDPPTGQDELEGLERQIENGVFLGRRMIIIILRAFGTCCGPKEVMEVWLRLERLWQPKRRRALDVLAVKEELEKQMTRVRR
jgi:pentatricopeptide repeat protein